MSFDYLNTNIRKTIPTTNRAIVPYSYNNRNNKSNELTIRDIQNIQDEKIDPYTFSALFYSGSLI